MRTVRLALAGVLGVSLLAVVPLTTSVLAQATSMSALAKCKTTISSQEVTKGVLTVATDNPAYTPWFVNNTPSNGKGYESAVAYAIAAELGVKRKDVKWVVEPFDSSYLAGPEGLRLRHQ